MKTVSASEAKAHFSQLIEEVANGETVRITRHGSVVATIEPTRDARIRRNRALFEELRRFHRDPTQPPITSEEIVAWIHEGRAERDRRIARALGWDQAE